MSRTPQFGGPHGLFKDRPGAYAVIRKHGSILTVFVRARFHLPGGGIDEGEDPEEAVAREVLEETGYTTSHLVLLGRANQFLETRDLGPINKIGTYFSGRISGAPVETIEHDHAVMWVSPETFLESPAHEFHKWAVARSIGLRYRAK